MYISEISSHVVLSTKQQQKAVNSSERVAVYLFQRGWPGRGGSSQHFPILGAKVTGIVDSDKRNERATGFSRQSMLWMNSNHFWCLFSFSLVVNAFAPLSLPWVVYRTNHCPLPMRFPAVGSDHTEDFNMRVWVLCFQPRSPAPLRSRRWVLGQWSI